MPALKQAPVAQATITEQVKLSPQLRRKLLTELKVYAELKSQIATLEHTLSKHRTTVEGLVLASGADSLEVEGYRTTLVAGVQKKLDKQRFVMLGGSLAMLEEATVETAKKPYIRITLPNEKEWNEE